MRIRHLCHPFFFWSQTTKYSVGDQRYAFIMCCSSIFFYALPVWFKHGILRYINNIHDDCKVYIMKNKTVYLPRYSCNVGAPADSSVGGAQCQPPRVSYDVQHRHKSCNLFINCCSKQQHIVAPIAAWVIKDYITLSIYTKIITYKKFILTFILFVCSNELLCIL